MLRYLLALPLARAAWVEVYDYSNNTTNRVGFDDNITAATTTATPMTTTTPAGNTTSAATGTNTTAGATAANTTAAPITEAPSKPTEPGGAFSPANGTETVSQSFAITWESAASTAGAGNKTNGTRLLQATDAAKPCAPAFRKGFAAGLQATAPADVLAELTVCQSTPKGADKVTYAVEYMYTFDAANAALVKAAVVANTGGAEAFLNTILASGKVAGGAPIAGSVTMKANAVVKLVWKDDKDQKFYISIYTTQAECIKGGAATKTVTKGVDCHDGVKWDNGLACPTAASFKVFADAKCGGAGMSMVFNADVCYKVGPGWARGSCTPPAAASTGTTSDSFSATISVAAASALGATLLF